MEKQCKKQYGTPAAEVVEVKAEAGFLSTGGNTNQSVSVGSYDTWQEDDI